MTVTDRLIVTGCGRSGTHWFAECLRRTGVPATHEHAFTSRLDGTQRRWIAEVSSAAAPYLPVDGAKVAHLVRHPLATMASSFARGVLSDNPPTRNRARLKKWVLDRCPEVAQGQTFLERVALYWVAWNQMVEPHAGYSLKVEEVVPGDVATLARHVHPDPVVPDLPAPLATSEHPVLTWQALAEHTRPEVCRRVAEMAERYGYR